MMLLKLIHVPGQPWDEQGLQNKKRRSTSGHPGTKSASRPGDKPVINRLQTDCQPVIVFPHSVYIGFRLFVFSQKGKNSRTEYSNLG